MTFKSDELLPAVGCRLDASVPPSMQSDDVAVRKTQPSYVDVSVWVADYIIYALADVHQVLCPSLRRIAMMWFVCCWLIGM